MSAPQYVRNQSQNSTFESLFPLLDCSEIFVGTLHYDFLDPPPTGTTRWATGVNPNDIYNINSGNVGIGTTNPPAKLSVAGSMLLTGGITCSAPIDCASDITCSTLNYTTLNPPISAGATGFWLINNNASGIFYDKKVAVNTNDFPQPETFYVNGSARIVSTISVPEITGLTTIVSPLAGSINSTFDNWTRVFPANVGNNFFLGGGSTRNIYVSRVGQMMSVCMSGKIQNTKPTTGFIDTTNVIPLSLFPFGLPQGLYICRTANDNTAQAFNNVGSVTFRNFNNNVALRISANTEGSPFTIPLLFGNFYGYDNVSCAFSIYEGQDAPI